MRLEGKIAIVVGAGQGPGTGMGNGRATTLRFRREPGHPTLRRAVAVTHHSAFSVHRLPTCRRL